MSILDLFSKRQKKLRGDVPDVYTYADLPSMLRTQIVHIWFDALGNEDVYFQGRVEPTYEFIVSSLCREYGVFLLPPAKTYERRHYMQELVNFFLREQDIERALDTVELSFRTIDRVTRDWNYLNRRDCGMCQ